MGGCTSFLPGLPNPHFCILRIYPVPSITLTEAPLELNYSTNSAHRFLEDSSPPLNPDSTTTDARFIAPASPLSGAYVPVVQWVPTSCTCTALRLLALIYTMPYFLALLPLNSDS